MEQSKPIFVGAEVTDADMLDRVSEDYRRLLHRTNGFILFDGGLHVRGAVLAPVWHSLRSVWLGDVALHKFFPAVGKSDIPFAQDCLGDQFLLRGGGVHKLEAEIGEVEDLGMGLDTVLYLAQEDPVEFLSLHPLLQFINEGGELLPGQLLSAYPPFSTKESAAGVSLRAVPMFERLRFLADYARQMSGMSEGGKIEVKVVHDPDGAI